MHYYKLNIADWNLSTSYLSLEAEAVYFRLINYYYDKESPIPLEVQPVLRRLRMASSSDVAMEILGDFFTKTEDGYIHERCDKIIKEYHSTAKKNKKNGKKGGRPRGAVAHSVSQNKPTGFPSESQNNPNQEPLTNNQEPLTNNKYDELFDVFWSSGIKKTNKKKSRSIFNKIISSQSNPENFSIAILHDIQKRLASGQLGFAEMHPTTYLNGERWTDEYTQTPVRNQHAYKPNQSLAEQSAAQTRIIQSRVAAGYFDQCPVGPDDSVVFSQVGESSGLET